MEQTLLSLPKDKLETFTFFDNSMLDKFRACPRSYLFRHVLNWAPEGISHDLVFGLCWHTSMDIIWLNADKPIGDSDLVAIAMVAFMETWYEHYPSEKDSPSIFTDEDERFPKVPSRATDMLYHYLRTKRAYLAKYKLIGIETPFIVPLPEFHDIFYIGRKDKTYEFEGRIKDVDHKTSKIDSDKWKATFFPNSQVDGYMYAGLITHGDPYWGVEIDGALCQKGSKKTAREDFPPGIGFTTVPIQRTLGFLDGWLWNTTYQIKQILANLEMLKLCKPGDSCVKAFDNHTTGCGYYKGCEYRDLCKFYENPLRFEDGPPRGFVVDKWSPFTLADITKNVVEGEGSGE